MAGGSGERFWPVSLPGRPKQLLDLTGTGKTMLDQAIERLAPVAKDGIFCSTSLALKQPIVESGILGEDKILAEPCKRNTLGALVWSIGALAHKHGDLNFLAAVTTADHLIRPDSAFQETVSEALRLAEETKGLVTIGIVPTRPETGYGYIQKGEGTRVLRFTEKPEYNLAVEFYESGNYLWNSGMFFWSAEAFRNGLLEADPLYAEVFDAIAKDLSVEAFEKLPNISVDYALMEKASNVHFVPSRFEWDDVGAWDSLRRLVTPDENGNAVVGNSRIEDSRDCIIYNPEPNSKVTIMGLDNIVVVVSEGKVVVFPADRSQDVRKLAAGD